MYATIYHKSIKYIKSNSTMISKIQENKKKHQNRTGVML